MDRGAIRNTEYAGQLRDFSGLRYGNITPTDMDALIEYHDRCYVLAETKYKGAAVPDGQLLALTRLVNDLKKPAVLFITSHTTPPGVMIDMANTTVERVYFRGKWQTFPHCCLKDAIDRFIARYGKPREMATHDFSYRL